MKSTAISRPTAIMWPAPPSTWLSGFLRSLRERRRHRMAVIHLRELDDYLLKDIGLRRDQVRSGRPFPARPVFDHTAEAEPAVVHRRG